MDAGDEGDCWYTDQDSNGDAAEHEHNVAKIKKGPEQPYGQTLTMREDRLQGKGKAPVQLCKTRAAARSHWPTREHLDVLLGVVMRTEVPVGGTARDVDVWTTNSSKG